MQSSLSKKIISLVTHSILFVFGIILTVAISTVIAFGTPPGAAPLFKSISIGRAPGDNVGINMFGTNPYGFFDLDYTDSAAPTGSGYSADVYSNKAGTTVSGYNVGVLGQNKQNAANKYGRVGVIGQVISPTQGVGRGILGYLEPTGPSASMPGDPNAIPTYVPLASGNLYGIYADSGKSRFANVTVGGTVTSSDGTVEFQGPTEFLDNLTINGTLTADRSILNPNLYKNSQTVNTYFAAPFLANDLNKMMFTVTNATNISTTSSAPNVQTSTAQCPVGSVRVSCQGRVSGSNNAASVPVGYSNYRGTTSSSGNGCRSYARKTSGGQIEVEAICMAAELP